MMNTIKFHRLCVSVSCLLDSSSAVNIMVANMDLFLVRGLHPEAGEGGVEQQIKGRASELMDPHVRGRTEEFAS